LSLKQTNRKLEKNARIKNYVRVQQKLGLVEQQTSLSIAVEFLSLRPKIFAQTLMWPFMLAVLDHPGLWNNELTKNLKTIQFLLFVVCHCKQRFFIKS